MRFGGLGPPKGTMPLRVIRPRRPTPAALVPAFGLRVGGLSTGQSAIRRSPS